MAEDSKIVAPNAGMLSAFGFKTHIFDLTQATTLLTQRGLEVKPLAHLPAGSMIMLLPPETASQLRAQVKQQPAGTGAAKPGGIV